MKKVIGVLVIFILMLTTVVFFGFAQEETERAEMSPLEKIEKATILLKEAREAYIKAQQLTKQAMEEVAMKNGLTMCDICKTCDALGCCEEPPCCPQPCIKVTEMLDRYIEKMPMVEEVLRSLRHR